MTAQQLTLLGGITRHPIYTGILGMLAGSLLVTGGGRWIPGFLVFFVLLEIKLHIEGTADAGRVPRRVPALPAAGAPAGTRLAAGRPAPVRQRVGAFMAGL